MQFKKGAELISSAGEKIGTLDRDEDDPEEVDIYYCYPPARGCNGTILSIF